MKYIAKGMVVKASTEDVLYVTRCGLDFQLTGLMADLWLNGRFGFAAIEDGNILAKKALEQLKRQELIELADDDPSGEYRALTQCVLAPAKTKRFTGRLNIQERETLTWIVEAGLHLTLAELVYLAEKGIAPAKSLLGEENRQTLTEAIYTQQTIFDNILEAQMEHAASRDSVVVAVLSLLKKKRILLL